MAQECLSNIDTVILCYKSFVLATDRILKIPKQRLTGALWGVLYLVNVARFLRFKLNLVAKMRVIYVSLLHDIPE